MSIDFKQELAMFDCIILIKLGADIATILKGRCQMYGIDYTKEGSLQELVKFEMKKEARNE